MLGSDMEKVKIRPYQASDHESVVRLWRTVFPDAPPRSDPVLDIRRKADVQPELFLVAYIDRTIIGTCMAGFDGHRGWVHLVAVAPEFRRRGVGSLLMGHAEAHLADLGCPKLNLQVRGSSPDAVRFYEQLGFRVEERISMGKVLPPGEVAAQHGLVADTAGCGAPGRGTSLASWPRRPGSTGQRPRRS